MKKVIVVGAGFGGLNFIRNASSNKEIEFTLIDKQNHHLFQPLCIKLQQLFYHLQILLFQLEECLKNPKM